MTNICLLYISFFIVCKKKSHFNFILYQEAAPCEGAEDWLSVAYHQLVTENDVSASKFVELTSSNPARLHNMYPRKGCVKEGSDADVVIWDPMRSVAVPESGSCRFELLH